MIVPRSTFDTLLRLLLITLAAALGACEKQPPVSPTAGDPGAVVAEGQLGAPLLLATGASTVYARIRISTLARADRARGPVNVALAIDSSGSMEGAAIEEARKAALQMIDALHDGDRLAVIAFHTKTDLLLSSTELSPEVRADVRRRVSKIQAQGTTDMSGGLQTAIAEVRSHFAEKGINRVVLLGDGIPNNPASMEETAKSAGEGGIAITTMGLGLDYDETLMGKLAQLSGGRYKYIEGADKMAGFFKEELERLNTVYARHAYAVLTAGPGVRIDSVVGAQETPSSERAFVQLGDIVRGEERDIVVRMTVTPRRAGVPIELLDTTITFDDALENAGQLERHVYLGAHTSEDEAKVVKAHNPEIDLAAAQAEAAATMITALELAKQGKYVRARDLLEKGAEAASAQAKRTPSPDLKKHAANMAAVEKDMPLVDLPAAAPSKQAPSYEFQDDAVQGEMIAPSAAEVPVVKPSVVRQRKEAHQFAVDSLR